MKLSAIFSLFLIVVLNAGANDEVQKYDSMINAFLLGLEERGKEIAHEILSNERYSTVQEETMFFIAEKFLTDAIRNDDYENYRSAYRLYSVFQERFPNSVYMDDVKYRINFIDSQRDYDLFYSLYEMTYNAEFEIIRSKLDVAEYFLQLHYPNPYELFAESRYNQDGITIMNKYLSDIMINHPLFEVNGYYQKILIKLDAFGEVETISEGIAPLDRVKISKHPSIRRYENYKSEVYSLLDEMSDKYPSHRLTLDLHLVFAKIFMERSRGSIDRQTLNHLEFILQNDPDRLSPRYLLAREFIENNSFQDE